LLALDCGSWLVAGALAKPATLRLARDFIRSCKPGISPTGSESGLAGILYLDEICKLVPAGESLTQNAWSLSVFSEAISVLSGDSRLAAHDWSPADIKHLQNFMILGGGAFAAALSEVRRSSKKGSLGFSDSSDGPVSHAAEISKFLPEEILSRFSCEILVLDSPSRQDFELAISRVHSELGINRQKPLAELVDQAVKGTGGMRWVENYLFRLLVAHPYAVRRGPSPKEGVAADPKERSFDLLVSDVPGCLKAANETAARLQVKLGVLYSRLFALSDRGVGSPSGGVLNNPEFGEALAEVIELCHLCSEVSGDDRDQLKPVARWRAMAWQGLTESSSELEKHNLTEIWVEAWSLAGTLIDLRLKLSQAVRRGLIA